jgi:hypothetical protein
VPVSSAAWTWPEKLDIPGHASAPADRSGKRLLGIRIDKYEWPDDETGSYSITVSLVNAGGNANGAVVGGCTLRYTARPLEKGWAVELAD